MPIDLRSGRSEAAAQVLLSNGSAESRRSARGHEELGQFRRAASPPCLSETDPFEPVMLFPVRSHPDAPRYFQGVHGPVNIIDEHRQRTSPQANLLMQLADCARGHILTGPTRTSRRSPRPVALAGRSPMMGPVQQQIPPSIRGTAGNNNCGTMRTITADWLTIPCSELSWTAEVSHWFILSRSCHRTRLARASDRTLDLEPASSPRQPADLHGPSGCDRPGLQGDGTR